MQCLVIRGIKECGLNIERTCYQTLWHWRCCQAQRGICRRLRHFWQLLRLKIVWPKLKFLCEKWLKKGTFGHISHQTVQAQKKNDFLWEVSDILGCRKCLTHGSSELENQGTSRRSCAYLRMLDSETQRIAGIEFLWIPLLFVLTKLMTASTEVSYHFCCLVSDDR